MEHSQLNVAQSQVEQTGYNGTKKVWLHLALLDDLTIERL